MKNPESPLSQLQLYRLYSNLVKAERVSWAVMAANLGVHHSGEVTLLKTSPFSPSPSFFPLIPFRVSHLGSPSWEFRDMNCLSFSLIRPYQCFLNQGTGEIVSMFFFGRLARLPYKIRHRPWPLVVAFASPAGQTFLVYVMYVSWS